MELHIRLPPESGAELSIQRWKRVNVECEKRNEISNLFLFLFFFLFSELSRYDAVLFFQSAAIGNRAINGTMLEGGNAVRNEVRANYAWKSLN